MESDMATSLLKCFGAPHQLGQVRLVRVARLAWMDDRNLATLGRLDQVRVGAGRDVRDICLLVLIVGEHLVVDTGALVAARAARGLDIRFFGRLLGFRLRARSRRARRYRRGGCGGRRAWRGDWGGGRGLRALIAFLALAGEQALGVRIV